MFEDLQTVSVLNWLIKKKCPKFIFLIKTKCNNAKMEKVRRYLTFENCFSMSSLDWSGGLTLLWGTNLEFKIQSYFNWHISASIFGLEACSICNIMSFYGHPDTSKRTSSSTLLPQIMQSNNEPWFVSEISMKSPTRVRKWLLTRDPKNRWMLFEELRKPIH